MRDNKDQTENIIERINKYKIHRKRQKKIIYSITSFVAVAVIVGFIVIPQIRQQDALRFVDENGLENSNTSSVSADGYIGYIDPLNDKNSLERAAGVEGGTWAIGNAGAVESATAARNTILPSVDAKPNENIIYGNVLYPNILGITNKISDKVTKYNFEPYNNMLEVVKGCLDTFNIKPSNLNNITIGAPFMIYDLDREIQDGIFYYPVFDNDKVILNVGIMVVSNGLSLSISQELVPQLNAINYVSGSCIFYESNGNIVVETSNQKINLVGSENELCRKFAELSFTQKIDKICARIDSFLKKKDN